MLKKIGIIVLNLVVMLLIVLGGTLLWIPGWLNDLTGHDNRVVVPSVIGQVADSAVLRLTDAGLAMPSTSRRWSSPMSSSGPAVRLNRTCVSCDSWPTALSMNPTTSTIWC